MKLKDILQPGKPKHIHYRELVKIDGQKIDIFTGVCYWDGENLQSLDGDTYSLEDKISKYSAWKEEKATGYDVWLK